MALPAARFTSQMAYLDTPEQYQRVKQLSDEKGTSKADIVREVTAIGLDVLTGKARIVYDGEE